MSLILRDGAAHLLAELHDELAKKTLALWNSRSGRAYHRYVPWMSCLPGSEDVVIDHPALSEAYELGSLVHLKEQLHNINEYLRLPQATNITINIFKNFAPKYAEHPIAQENVESRLIKGFETAKDAVLKSHPLFEALFDRLVHCVIPIRMSESKMDESLDLARGAVFMSFFEPLDQWEIQLNLAHEFGHQALMILNSADPLFDSDIMTPVFSGVRMTERPAIQSLHAATALAFITLFTGERADSTAQATTVMSVTQLQRTIASLRDNCVMTELGQAIVDDYQQLCDEVRDADT